MLYRQSHFIENLLAMRSLKLQNSNMFIILSNTTTSIYISAINKYTRTSTAYSEKNTDVSPT